MDRILLRRSHDVQQSWPAAAIATALGLLWVRWSLSRPAARATFGERGDDGLIET
jgi:hypothetical protein